MKTFEVCLEICQLDAAHFLSASELSYQAASKKTKVKLDLLIDIDALLMIEKGIIGRICLTIYRYVKANNKYIIIY